MSNTILIKRSSTPNAVPTANSISQGELAINLVDGNLFYKNSTDQVTVIASNKFVTVSGNVDGGNIVTSGQVSATGNITGNYILGNGALLTGIDAASIQNGNSNVRVVSSGGNVAIGIGGTANVAVFATTGLVITGNVDATAFNGSGAGLTSIPGANVTGQVSNALVAGTVYTAAQPNITSVGTLSSLSVTGTVTGGNLATAGTVSATGNITGGNIDAVRASFTTVAGTLETAAQPNITSVGILTSVSVTGNVDAGNISGNGAALSSITGANVTGQVANALVAGTVYTNAQPNITSVGTLTSVSVTGTVDAGNINGNGSGLSAITGANVTGQVGNALVAGTVYTAAQPNITSVGTLSSLSVTGNVNAGNVNATLGAFTTVAGTLSTAAQPNITSVGTLTSVSVTGNVDAGNVNGNGSGLSAITGSNVTGQVGNALVAGTVYTNAQPNITSVGTLSSLSVTGTVTGGNVATAGTVSATGNITGNYVIGNGSQLTGVTATDVGTLTTLSVTGNVTAGNVNTAIVSATGNVVGANLVTTGTVYGADALFTGNLTVDGNVTYINITNLNVQDPIIGLGRGPNNTPLTTNDGKDRGTEMWYYADSEKAAFVGYQNLSGKIIAASNVTLSGEVVTVNEYGTMVVGTLESAAVSATGNVTGGNLVTGGVITATGTVTGGNIATAGTVSATGTITGGNLSTGGSISATVNISAAGNVIGGNIVTAGLVDAGTLSGNGAAISSITGANVTGQVGNALVAGTVYTAAQPNITSVGTLSSLSVTGTVTGGNISTAGAVTAGTLSGNGAAISSITGANVTGQVANALVAGTVYTAAQPNITSVGTLSSLSVTGTVTGGNIVTAGTGNIATLEITTLANIKSTTAASSTTTGALIVAGGVGVAGNVYAGEVYAAGNEVLTVISTVDGGTY